MNDHLQAIAKLAGTGDLTGARQLCLSVLEANETHAPTLHWLGNIEAQIGNYSSAASCFERALELEPERARWWRDAGVLYLASGKPRQAVSAFAKLANLDGNSPATQKLLGVALLRTGRSREAFGILSRLTDLYPEDSDLLLNLGRAMSSLGRTQSAYGVAARLVEMTPESVGVRCFCASVCRKLGRHGEQLLHAERAWRSRPDATESRWAYALACFDNGRLEESLRVFRDMRDSGSLDARSYSYYLSVLLHSSDQDAASLLAEHKKWAQRFAPSRASALRPENSLEPNRPLRIGYVTGEFIRLPSRYFLLPILRLHDRSRFEIICYHTRTSDDSATSEYKALASGWHDAGSWTDSQLESAIRRDAIDILVDLSGHYPFGRLRLFAKRPAPVQIAYPNYPSTTGLGDFDAIITDEWTTPVGIERYYTEPVCRLASGYLTYQPPDSAPDIGRLPCLQNGFVTFGVFQRPAKYNDEFWRVVLSVLSQTPESRLLIHFGSCDVEGGAVSSRTRIEAELSARGVGVERLQFRPGAQLAEHLSILSECDIALDTFPYNGQTTTCECLWMGVPVVTLAGDSHVSRATYGLLARLDLADWTANSVDEYIDLTLCKASDWNALAEFRKGIRSRLLASTVCNAEATVRELETVYRDLWRQWCDRNQTVG